MPEGTISSLLGQGAPVASTPEQTPPQAQQQSDNPPASPTQMAAGNPNQPQFNGQPSPGTPENNSVQSLINSVMSGQDQQQQAPQGPPVVNPRPEQATPPTPPNPGEQATQIVEQFMRTENIQVDVMDGVDINAAIERVTAGEPQALFDAMNAVGNNAMNMAMAAVVRMLPRFSEQMVAQAVEQARTVTQIDSTWGEFTKAHPGFSSMEKAIRPTLEQMLKVPGTDRQAAFQAAAQLFSGAITAPTDTNDKSDNPGSQSKEFNLTDYLTL